MNFMILVQAVAHEAQILNQIRCPQSLPVRRPVSPFSSLHSRPPPRRAAVEAGQQNVERNRAADGAPRRQAGLDLRVLHILDFQNTTWTSTIPIFWRRRLNYERM